MEPRANMPEPPGWRPLKPLSPEQAAKVLRMSPRIVRDLLRAGRIDGVEVTPRRWKTTEAALEKFMSSGGMER